MTRPCVLVGAHGLLGQAVGRVQRDRGGEVVPVTVNWSDPTDAPGSLRAAATQAHERWGDAWDLLWCAGAAVTGASEESFARELRTFRACIDVLADEAHRCSQLFVASSAGAVYAGGDAPPYTELSAVAPMSGYGRAKLALEEAAATLSSAGTRVLVGRISNLYGPGQNLAKGQGLVSRLCLTYLTRDPAAIYVSLDTIRDYLYVDDCASLILDAMVRLSDEDPGTVVTKILASQTSVTVGALIASCRQVFGPRVPVTLGASPLASQQARDLRFRSVMWPELDDRTLTPLIHGIHATCLDLRALVTAPAG